jgi:polysaccharide pyruvyl transferase WcaK-like protein
MIWPVRRVALYGYIGSGNIGNDATFEVVLRWLKSAHSDVDVGCITIAPEVITARYGVPSAPLAWRSPGHKGNRVMMATRKLLGRLLDVPRSYALAGLADAIIVPGMGVLEETLGVMPWALPLWLFLIAVACRMRKRRFVLLDVGAAWAANPITRWLYVATVDLATHVSYRDRASAAAMARAGAREPEAVAPDLAFAHPAPTPTEPEPGRLVVGVMAYYGHEDDPIGGADVRRRYVATMADALAELADAGNHMVLVGGDRVDFDVARDMRAAVFASRPGLPDDAVVVRELTTFAEVTEEMMRAQVVIASRFHNLICALRVGRPTVSIGYASKCRHLMEALGLDGYWQEIERLSASLLVTQIRDAQNDGEQLAARIQHGTSHYADEVKALLEQVAREDLGLAVRQSREFDAPDDIAAWRAT